MDSDSDSSALSSAPEDEVKKLAPIFLKAKKATKLVAPPPKASPPRPKREASPPHEEVLADNPDIAFIVMFRSRFNECFPGKCPHFGPQDIERGVVDSIPSPEVQHLLCALLGLVLNRKKPVERTSYGRALEEAVLSHKTQWPYKWAGQNPLHGGKDFNNMNPAERLNLLRTLVIWALGSSELVSGMIRDKYKQQRHHDDENQPLSVQPWGNDGDKRRYFLIQGLDDTGFRVYRESSRHTRNAHWYNQAGTIEEVKALAEKLDKVDGSQAARRLSIRITNAIPMFEATQEKRQRREYRQQRRAAFSRPEPGFGIYEGRTRGKRMRYTYDENEDGEDSDATSTRRSTRGQSSRSTPFEAGPSFTASGRQIKQPRQGAYGESLLSTNVMTTDELGPDYSDARSMRSGTADSEHPRASGRPSRAAARGVSHVPENPRKRKHIDGYNAIDEMSDEDDDADSDGGWDSDKNGDDEDEKMDDADDADSESSEEVDEDSQRASRSLIVTLKVPQHALAGAQTQQDTPPTSPPSRGEEQHPKCEPGMEMDTKPNAPRDEPKPTGPQPGMANGIKNEALFASNGAFPSVAEHTIPATKLPLSPKVLVPYGEAHQTQYPTSVATQHGLQQSGAQISGTVVNGSGH
ncbi:hypothetical protein AC578_9544 [Pseudocercospora eumusae]|uniref:WHIM1 domain-containing protein n=1 Tax=Pseudocercospora eumusae TaxID=321146 RepID=A0A139HG71_9PEZI|nr:hypothetical protein AC578_9544 [Pseudocercospora eumusae]